jgi:preprotein translocase subunit SecD
MIVRWDRFNNYFLLSLLLAGLTACESTPESKKKSHDKKLATVIQLHLEAHPDNSGHQDVVSILRDSPVKINVQKATFLSEANVAEANVIEAMGGFKLSIKFDRHGRLVLEQYSSSNPGRRFAIYAQFGEGLREARWLAAPLIQKRIGDGVLTFTPDASREEAEEIVRGLNNVAKKVQGKGEEW